MRTVIMAGGKGARIKSVRSDIPKPMIPINGKPVLQYEIECLHSQGYDDIIMTVSYMSEKIIEYFGDGSAFGVKIKYFYEEKPLGNGGALFKLWANGDLEAKFLLLNADSMYDINFKRFEEYHNRHKGLATLYTHPNSHPYDSGIIVADNNNVVRKWIAREDDRPEYYGNCTNAGVHILDPEAFSLSEIDPDEIDDVHRVDLDRDVLKPLVKTGRVFTYNSSEYIKDMGTPERLRTVSRDIQSGVVKKRNLSNPQRAIFLDRDGTINRYAGFIRSYEDFEILPGVSEAIRHINDSGYLCIVITNQPVVARGEASFEDIEMIHNKMETILGKDGAYLDALYYCPHHPDRGFLGEVEELKVECDCRKPKPGMILQAADDYNIDLSLSWMVGDSETDVICGKKAGCHTVYLGKESIEECDYVANNLLDAIRWILD